MRTYKRRTGARSYRQYSKETLDEALLEVSEGRSSLIAAPKKFKIPVGTLHNKFVGKHGRRCTRTFSSNLWKLGLSGWFI